MAKHRVGRLAGEIQKEVAQIISRDLKDPRLDMVSVVAVEVAPDGCSARLFISPMAGSDFNKKDVQDALQSAKGYIRRQLGQRLKVRAMPELYFEVDESIARGISMAQKINEQIAEDTAAAADRPPIDESIYED